MWLVIAVVLGLLGIGLGVFIATFDADRYRPLVVEQLSKSVGRPVSLQRLSLAWRGGVAVEARGLAIGEAAHPALQVERVSATLKLWPLLHRDVRIGAVVIAHPIVRVVRDAQGRIDVLGVAAMGAPAAALGRQATVGGPPAAPNFVQSRAAQAGGPVTVTID